MDTKPAYPGFTFVKKRPRVSEIVVAPVMNWPDVEQRRRLHQECFVWTLERNRRGDGIYVVQCVQKLDHHKVLAEVISVDAAQLLRNQLDRVMRMCIEPPIVGPLQVEPETARKFAHAMGMRARK